MARPSAADIEIAGKPFVFPPKSPGVLLGFAGKEPGTPGAVQTLEIGSFHLGPGEYIAQTPGRFFNSYNVELGVPGQVSRAGTFSVIASAGVFEAAVTTQDFYLGGAILVTKADGASVDKIVFVSPGLIRVSDAGADTNVVTRSPPANTSYTGSVSKHKGKLYFPIEGRPAHATPRQAVGMDVYTISTAAFALVSNAANYASRVYSHRGMFWWVQNKGLGGVPEIREHPTPADPPPSDVAGPFPLAPGNYCTGLQQFGYWLRAAMADGNLHGVDEEGTIAAFLPEIIASPSTKTGSQMVSFLGKVAVSAPGRIYAIDLASLEVSDITPPVLQGEVEWAAENTVPALYSDGVDLWAATVNLPGSQLVDLWRLLQYPDGSVSWQRLNSVLEPSGNDFIPAALLIWDGGTSGRFAYILCQEIDNTLGPIIKVRLPRPGNTPILSSGSTVNLLETSRYRASALVSAKFLQVRGFQRRTPASAWFVTFEIDGSGSFGALSPASISAAGMFSLAFPATTAAIGRLVALRLGTGDPGQIALPLYIDYFELPSATDDLTIEVLVSDGAIANRGNVLRSMGRIAGVEHLRLQKHQIITVSFLDTVNAQGKQVTWSVFVVDVQVEGARAEMRPADAVVKLYVRRL